MPAPLAGLLVGVVTGLVAWLVQMGLQLAVSYFIYQTMELGFAYASWAIVGTDTHPGWAAELGMPTWVNEWTPLIAAVDAWIPVAEGWALLKIWWSANIGLFAVRAMFKAFGMLKK